MLALHLPAVSSTARELELGSLGTRRRVVGREVITIVGCFSRETGEAEAEVVEVEEEEEELLYGENLAVFILSRPGLPELRLA